MGVRHQEAQVIRLGAELGPVPAADLLPPPSTFLACLAVEGGDAGGEGSDDDSAAAVTALHRLLGRTPRPWCGPALDAALVGLDPTWAAAQAVRLAAAVAAGLLAGHLPAGRPWGLHIDDPVRAAGPALGPVLDLLAGLLDGWDLTVAPPAVSTNLGSLRRAGAGYEPAPGRLTTVPDLWIDLVPGGVCGDVHPPRPTGLRDAPTVVVCPAPAGALDPGPPPPVGLPVDPAAALAAGARWCFAGPGAPGPDGLQAVARLLAGAAPAPDDPAWLREAADLELAAHPDQTAAWCRRALVEARHPAASSARHARLVAAAAGTAAPAGDLRRHASDLRAAGRPSWVLHIWAVADAGLEAQLVEDVLDDPASAHLDELGLALAKRVEAAAMRCRVLVPSQTEG